MLETLVARFAKPANVRVLTAWHNDLVPLVERGEIDTPAIRNVLREILGPLAEAGVDQLALASTHFAFLKPVIAAEFSDAFGFVDSAGTVAANVARLLEQRNLGNSSAGLGSALYLFTEDVKRARATVTALQNSIMPDGRIAAEDLDVRPALFV